jgi:hypothetical protein
MTEDQVRISALEQELRVLQTKHATLGEAYRTACEEVTRLRKENEDCRARLHAVHLLCAVSAP